MHIWEFGWIGDFKWKAGDLCMAYPACWWKADDTEPSPVMRLRDEAEDGWMDGCPFAMHNCSYTLPNTTYMFLNLI